MISIEELMLQLAKGEVAEVLGVVGPKGIGIFKHGKEQTLMLKFAFTAWKYVNGPIQQGELTVRKPSNKDEFILLIHSFSCFDVVRIRARLARQNCFVTSQALLIEFIGKESSDEELNRYALKLQEPVTFEDSRFGTFTFYQRIGWYEAKTFWLSSAVLLHLQTDEPEQIVLALKQAHLLWDSSKLWNERIAEFAAAKLLDLYNSNWRPEVQPELSAEQFKSIIKLESILVNETGRFQFWYEGGNLFAGHAIMVRGDLVNGPKNASIEG